ncbi:MAG TPA: TetR/AcrR family transcriptional regulator [Actinocrinis sp.]|nr:TetR/AcrR family transcriptional regulator [Actinocrinis sp.]
MSQPTQPQPIPSSRALRPAESDDCRAPGRKRDASRDADLCRAALEVLTEVGYDRLTVDAVATRAGAGKATVYRRWSDKADLVSDAVSRMKEPAAQPDTGSLRGDLEAIARHFDPVEDQFKMEIMAGLVSALVHDTDLRAAFAQNFLAPREQVFRTVFDRAVDRGEIAPHPNPPLVAKILMSMAFHRMITTGQPPDTAFALTIIDQIIMPLATAPASAFSAAAVSG